MGIAGLASRATPGKSAACPTAGRCAAAAGATGW